MQTGTLTWSVWTDPDSGGFVTFKVKVLSEAEAAGKVVNTATVQIGSDTPEETNEVKNPLPAGFKAGTEDTIGSAGSAKGTDNTASSVKTKHSTVQG